MVSEQVRPVPQAPQVKPVAQVEQIVPTPHQGPLWFSFLAGPVLWSVQLLVAYAVASLSCNTRSSAGTPILHVLTVTFALVTLYAGYRAWRRWRVLNLQEETVASGGGSSAAFLALSGVFLSVIFVLMIFSEDIAIFVLTPCQGGH